jgi:glutamate dehydrogenase/leucine dehydrogenase
VTATRDVIPFIRALSWGSSTGHTEASARATWQAVILAAEACGHDLERTRGVPMQVTVHMMHGLGVLAYRAAALLHAAGNNGEQPSPEQVLKILEVIADA